MLTLAGLCVGCPSPAPPQQPQGTVDRYLVGAHYHLDFPEAFHRGFLRGGLTPPQAPKLGLYHSVKATAVERHIEWASQFGIDFFALDYWPNRPPQDIRPELFLEASNISDIRFCLAYEMKSLGYHLENDAIPVSEATIDQFLTDLAAAEPFLKHPQYLKVGGRPVLLLRDTGKLYGRHVELLERARQALSSRGAEPILIGDEMNWATNSSQSRDPELPPEKSSEPQSDRIRLFDAVTSFSLFDGSRAQHNGYAAASNYLDDLKGLSQRYIDATAGEIPVVPTVIPGYNARGQAGRENEGVLPRPWKTAAAADSFYAEQFKQYALPFLEPRLPIIFVNSWNNWGLDTAIEPLEPAAATSEPEELTGGFPYVGFGELFLQRTQNSVIAVSGKVTTPSGQELEGIAVWAHRGDEVVGQDRTDSAGRFHMSRLKMDAGEYRLACEGSESVTVTVEPTGTTQEVELVSLKQPSQTVSEVALEAKFPFFREGLEAYVAEFPASSYQVSKVGEFEHYLGSDLDPVQDSWSRGEVWEPELEAELARLLRPGDRVVEVGSRLAAHTLTMAKLVGPSGQVFCFEADREAYRELVQTLALNKATNVSPHWFSIDSQAGIVGSGVVGEIRSLDSFQLSKVALVRIESEEPESVLEGARKLLKRESPLVVVRLPEPDSEPSVQGAFAALGYRMDKLKAESYFLGTPLGSGQDRVVLDLGVRGSRRHLEKGLSRDERDWPSTTFIWSEDIESLLHLPITRLRSSDYILGLRASAFAPIAPVKVSVLLNGADLGMATFEGDFSGVEMKVPKGLLRQGKNKLVLRYSKVGRPSHLLEGNADSRAISLALDKVWLVPSSSEG